MAGSRNQGLLEGPSVRVPYFLGDPNLETCPYRAFVIGIGFWGSGFWPTGETLPMLGRQDGVGGQVASIHAVSCYPTARRGAHPLITAYT